ncbi:membrane dipeptidase [Olleya sp. R77988]|uniref:membrane dipeptidase n=1 Tax=Olleya sp. R77988 TaxID=3093875 RepID=UPI0037C81785
MKHFIDLHCHPALKPFGKSFKDNNATNRNSSNEDDENSIWNAERPKVFRKVLNVLLSLTKFRQSDINTVLKGNGKVIIASLYPMEKGMVVHDNTKKVKLSGRILRNLATGISMERIKHIQNMPDYFVDLCDEYKFYEQLHDTNVLVNGVPKKYKLVKKYSDIDFNSPKDTLYVIMSIEGCHVFNTGLRLAGKPTANKNEVISNIETVKNWKYKPFFVGIAHHFDNELCGHAESLAGIVKSLIDQNANKNKGLTPLGKDVILKLLDNTNGKRIQIDLKHMNIKSRYEYYAFLEANFTETIPLIVSHGAINGRLEPKTHNRVWHKGFNTADINFYMDEIQKIERSKGIFGIQLDERRILNKRNHKDIYKEAKKTMTKKGKPLLRKQSFFIWRQIEHIAIYLNVLGRDAWNIQALGTDFDGIIDPLNGIWTAKEIKDIHSYLVNHAKDFLNSPKAGKLSTKNKLSAQKIIDKFMFENAKDFMEMHFV